MKCPECKNSKNYKRVMRHVKESHPKLYQEECDRAVKMFKSGMTLREIGNSPDALWSFGTGLTYAIQKKISKKELAKTRIKRLTITMQKKYQKNNTNKTKPKDPPYDETNSSNPWLLNKNNRQPIIGPKKHRLTAEYIWEQEGDDRIKLVKWVFKHYRKKGFPFFTLTDQEIKDEFAKLKAKDSSKIVANGIIKNSNTAGLNIAKHFTSELFFGSKENKGKSCIEAFNNDELFMKVLKNRMGWNSSSEDGEKRPYVFAIDDHMIIQGMRSSRIGSMISNFKPMLAKYIYEKYNVKKTIDFSGGWGARAIAALSCGIEYYGIDPLTSDKINDIIKYFNGTGNCIKDCSEKADYSIFPNVDFCFSSPPYFDLEIYDDDETQSSNYKDYNDWLEKYWRETVKRCYTKTKYFSFVAMDRVRKFDLLNDLSKICEEEGGKLVESMPIKVAKGHLSGKKQSGKNTKKTECLVVYKI